MIFRIEKNTNYTAMSTYHLYDTKLSLEAKGLLSLMLFLSETENTNCVTLANLSEISRESVHVIETAVSELEREGYVTRSRGSAKNGKLAGAEYVVREYPETQSAKDDGETR
jgi:DNA-binding MarR family transcriptional regulator